MNEHLRRHHQTTQTWMPPIPGSDDAADDGGAIDVISGTMTDHLEAGGMSVGDVFRVLRVPWSIAPDAAALVNGRPANADQMLLRGDVLEFARAGGEKGARGGKRARGGTSARRNDP